MIKFALIVTATLITGVSIYVYQTLPSSPEDALQRFHSEKVAEDQIIDPLILIGKPVVPLLLKEVKDRNMEGRRYAIAALGHLEDQAALSTLEDIFKDDSETDYYRCDALNAIALLNPNVGLAFAKVNANSATDCIGQLSRALVSGELPTRRTYFQALTRQHD